MTRGRVGFGRRAVPGGAAVPSCSRLMNVGFAGVRAVGQQEKLFVGMILILIFAEALGLYGLIVALILSQQSADCQ